MKASTNSIDSPPELRDVEGVTTVRSMAQPLGDDPRKLSFSRRRQVKGARRHSFTKETFVTQVDEFDGSVTRLDVILDTDPFSGNSIATLDRIDERLLEIAEDPQLGWQGAEFDYIGTTAGIRDLTAVNKSDRWLIQQLVVLAVFGVLLVVIRRPVILCVPDDVGRVRLSGDDRYDAIPVRLGLRRTPSSASTGRCPSTCS